MMSLMAAALLSIKEPGGIRAVIGQISTDCIMGDSMTRMRTESIGTRFEVIDIH